MPVPTAIPAWSTRAPPSGPPIPLTEPWPVVMPRHQRSRPRPRASAASRPSQALNDLFGCWGPSGRTSSTSAAASAKPALRRLLRGHAVPGQPRAELTGTDGFSLSAEAFRALCLGSLRCRASRLRVGSPVESCEMSALRYFPAEGRPAVKGRNQFGCDGCRRG